jgi:hypothetical protein
MDNIEKEEYMCPLTLNYMKNPVLASDGNIYEKEAIMKWYNTDTDKLSPLNREKLKNIFIDQPELKEEIDKFLIDNNINNCDIDPIFNSKTIYINCPKCNQKLQIINKDHKYYRCGNIFCKQIITLLDSTRMYERIHTFRELHLNNNDIHNFDHVYINRNRRNISVCIIS